jgi:hypothetical protein
MASVTLAESAKLTQNLLLAGVIETIVTVNPIYEVFPFMEIDGNALAYNRELVAGDSQYLGVGGTITAKAAATFTAKSAALTTLIGDAEVNLLIEATRSNYTDQKAVQVASKAKSIGRQYQQGVITGDGTADSFEGLLTLVPSGQKVASATDGQDLSFDILDQLLDLVKDKDGEVDYIMMNARTIRSYYALLRALGGANISETTTLPSGRKIPNYRGVPIFRNDYIPINQTQGATTSSCTTIFAGTFDDGSGKIGLSGITARGASGIRVEDVGISATKDESITRVKMYSGLALFSELGIASASGIHN